ncbi:MAG TPA: glutamine--fructose-6-phosphate transaminase (isomerizing) [Acidobacteriota bacterium]|nr:glutamine--fructose-6-phosphate transaminase (isomerizing) [Acidobacteriota bacterium]
MCGIVGYIGKKEVVPVLIDSLKRLEYRGYDSAGIAVVNDGELLIRRAAGKLSNLEDVLQHNPVHGIYGMGHTRWATHGRPTEENAHPHRDCQNRIVVVHNGIIENYLELKHALLKAGHRFVTETDTEIVAHLIEKYYEGNLENAVLKAFVEIRGVYAIVALSVDEPNKIIGVRNGPPLVIGIGKGEYFIASDVSALLHHTRDFIFLDNREMAIITPEGSQLLSLDGQPIKREPHSVNWDPLQAEKGGYKHYMLKEIFEQPRAIRETIVDRFSLESGKIYLNGFRFSEKDLAGVQKINLIAAGTSWHAALVGKFLLEELARVATEVDISSEFRYRKPIVPPGTLTVAITQSGETADTIAAIREAKQLGSLTMAITNVAGSMIVRETQGALFTHAGPEIGVASTKAFTTQLVAFYLFALHMAELRNTLPAQERIERIQGLTTIANLVEAILERHEMIEEIARKYHNCSDFLYLGRGMNYPIALEGALKLKEISYIHAEGYPAGEMKHGPIALIDEKMPVVALMPKDRHFEKILSNVNEARSREGKIIAIATEGEDRVHGIADDVFYIPETDPLLTPLLTVIPLQLLAYYIAIRRGCDVDQPRNLAKSVTVE